MVFSGHDLEAAGLKEYRPYFRVEEAAGRQYGSHETLWLIVGR